MFGGRGQKRKYLRRTQKKKEDEKGRLWVGKQKEESVLLGQSVMGGDGENNKIAQARETRRRLAGKGGNFREGKG